MPRPPCRPAPGSRPTPTAEPLSQTKSDAVIRALGDHGLPAVSVPHLGQEATAALPQAGSDARQVRRITALADRRITLPCRFAQWTLAALQSVARGEERYPPEMARSAVQSVRGHRIPKRP